MYGNENRKRACSLGWTSSLGLLCKHTTDWWLIDNRDLLLSVIEPGKSKVKLPANPVSDERLLSGSCMAVFHSSPLDDEGIRWGNPLNLMREFPGVFFLRALISFMRVLPSWPNHLPKTTPPGNSTLGIKFQHMNLGAGDTNIQSMANHMYLPDLSNSDLHKQQFQVAQPNRYTGDWPEYVKGLCQPLFFS